METRPDSAGAAADSAGRAVLLVEDSPTQAARFNWALSDQGFQVTVVKTVQGALAHLDAEPVDLILLDLGLPDADGIAAVSRLRAAAPRTPVVVLTAKSEEELAKRALLHGVQDYLFKGDVSDLLLLRTIRYAIERQRFQNRLADGARALEATNEELAAKNTKLEQLDREKSRLLGVAAHDIRSPIAVVRGYVDFLLTETVGPLNDAQTKFLKTSRECCDRIVGLLEDLLDVSEIQLGKLRLEREPLELRGFLERHFELARAIAGRKGIDVALEFGAVEVPVSADRARLAQVIDNLVSNAVKFSEGGTRIEVRLVHEDGEARLAIADQGCGIPAAELERLFLPFERHRREGTAGERGTGLGLAIVRSIVEAHGGRVWADSVLEQGTTFHVALPLGAG